jgi:hypothetical protein
MAEQHEPAAAASSPARVAVGGLELSPVAGDQQPTAGTCGCCWPRGGCRSAGSLPVTILACRAMLETYHDLRAERTAWVQRIHAVLFHHGAPALGEGTLRTRPGMAAPRAAAAAHLSPAAGRHGAGGDRGLEGRLHELGHQLLGAARHLTGGEGPGRAAVGGRAGHRAGTALSAASGHSGVGCRRLALLIHAGLGWCGAPEVGKCS